jgi:hypothetical protein
MAGGRNFLLAEDFLLAGSAPRILTRKEVK